MLRQLSVARIHSFRGSGANRNLTATCTPDLAVERLAEPYIRLLGILNFPICTRADRIDRSLGVSSVRLNIEQIHLVGVLRLIGACRIEPQGA